MTLKKKSPSTDAELEEGVYAAALTPLKLDLSCDSEELASHCIDLIQRGCKGVVLFGTSGEGPSFSVKERIEVLGRVIESGLDPNKIMMGSGGMNVPDTVDLALACLQLNVRTLLITPPTFFKNVMDDGVIAFYREIIQKVANPNLQVILYHIPQFTSVPITLNIIEALHSKFPRNVIGIKESEGNLVFTKKIIAAFPSFKVFVGNERQIIEAVHAGAAGSICGIANLDPELICSLYDQGKRGYCKNPIEIDHFFEALKGYPFIQAFKVIMEKARGEVWHLVRPPLVPLHGDKSDEFLSALEKRNVNL